MRASWVSNETSGRIMVDNAERAESSVRSPGIRNEGGFKELKVIQLNLLLT